MDATLAANVLNPDPFDLDDAAAIFVGLFSSLFEPGRGIVPGPRYEGMEGVFEVGEGVIGASRLQVFPVS